MDRTERDRGADRPGDQPESEALDAGEDGQVAATRAAGAQQREAPPVAVDCAERREVGKSERDESSRNGENDVERLRVERVARCGVQVVREVVDEHDLTGKRALDAVAKLRRLGQRVR